jgi:putative Holliday junction resolvase
LLEAGSLIMAKGITVGLKNDKLILGCYSRQRNKVQMTPHIRILGLDLGEKRLGVALSDALGITAQGLSVIQRQGRTLDLDKVVDLVKQHQVQEIVIGLPRHMDGRLGGGAEEVFIWVKELQDRLGLPVHTMDERLTTLQAERILLAADVSRQKRRKVIDKMAAGLILQAYLDIRSHSPEKPKDFEP